MKKVIALILIATMLVSLVFTSCGDTNNTTSCQKTGKERLCEHILTTCENVDDTHIKTQFYEDGYFSITCTKDEKLVFYSCKESEYGNFYAELDYVENSETLNVKFEYEVQEYLCTATGVIYSNVVTSDVCEIMNVTFTHNLPEGSTPTAEEIVNTMFSPTVKLMLSQLNLTLGKDTDVSMQELGFSNWK